LPRVQLSTLPAFVLDFKPRDDTTDQLADLLLGVVTVFNVAHPQTADRE
jgi:hypothetical protein